MAVPGGIFQLFPTLQQYITTPHPPDAIANAQLSLLSWESELVEFLTDMDEYGEAVAQEIHPALLGYLQDALDYQAATVTELENIVHDYVISTGSTTPPAETIPFGSLAQPTTPPGTPVDVTIAATPSSSSSTTVCPGTSTHVTLHGNINKWYPCVDDGSVDFFYQQDQSGAKFDAIYDTLNIVPPTGYSLTTMTNGQKWYTLLPFVTTVTQSGSGSCPAPPPQCPTTVINFPQPSAPTVAQTADAQPTAAAAAPSATIPCGIDNTQPTSTRFAQFVGCVVQFGKQLLQSQSGNASVASGGWLAIINSLSGQSGTAKSLDAAITRWLGSGWVGYVASTWVNTCSQLWGSNATNLQCVQAVRSFVDCLNSLVSSGGSSHNSTSGSAFSLSGGVVVMTTNTNTGYTDGVHTAASASLRVELMPLREALDLCIRYLQGLNLPGISDSIHSYLRGTITLTHCQTLIQFNGGDWGEWQNVINASRLRLTPDQYLELAYRAGNSSASVTSQMQALGVIDQETANGIVTLYDEIPPTSQILSYFERHVYSDSDALTYGLDEGVTEVLNDPASASIAANGTNSAWLKQLWRGHWRQPTLEEAADMYFRLRPGRVDPSVQFTSDDLTRSYQQNGVPPGWRLQYTALMTPPISMRYLRGVYDQGSITQDELTQRLMDLRFSQADATLISQSMEYAKRRKDASEGRGYTTSELQKLYNAGVISQDVANSYLQYLGFSSADQQEFYKRAASDWQLAVNEKTLKVLERQVVRGFYDITTVHDTMSQMGLNANQISQYLTLWAAEQQHAKHNDTPAELHQWFSNGLITAAQYANALQNVGYDVPSATAIVASSTQQIAAKQAASLAKSARQTLADATKHQAQAAREIVAQLKFNKVQAGITSRLLIGQQKRGAKTQKAQARSSEIEAYAATTDTTARAKLRADLVTQLDAIDSAYQEEADVERAKVAVMPPPVNPGV